jgi:hypothetical protein
MSRTQWSSELQTTKHHRLQLLGKTQRAFMATKKSVRLVALSSGWVIAEIPSQAPHRMLDSQLCKVRVCLVHITLMASNTGLTQHGHSINICWVSEFHWLTLMSTTAEISYCKKGAKNKEMELRGGAAGVG